MSRKFLIVLVFLLLGCNNDEQLSGFFSSSETVFSQSRAPTIEACEFKSGQLRICGSCGKEGEILLVLPTTKRDQRIIGSPRCRNGRYEVVTSTYGRPPCGVVVEYGGDKSVGSKVKGAEAYCP